MPDLEILGRAVLAVRALRGPTSGEVCLLPAPRPGEVCSLPTGHDGQHEVQILAFVTIDRFTSDLEVPMTDDPKRDAAQKRGKHEETAAKPARPRTTPTPREVRPEAKPDQR